MQDDYLTMGHAAEMLGISKATMWRRVKAGEIEAFESSADRRQKLVRRSDIESMMQPVRIEPGKEPAAQNLAA